MSATAQLRRLAGSLVMGGIHGIEIGPESRELLEKWHMGGVILFARNIENPEQVAALNRALSEASSAEPLLIAVDQEGGRVQRLGPPVLQLPPAGALARAGADEGLFHRMGRALGLELRALGFNIDFAPVLDVDSNPENPVIGDRAFSTDPRRATELALSFARGLMESGTMPCGKHYPGHGDTQQDSHFDLPRLAHGMKRLRQTELVPFEAAARRGLPSMMTAHVIYEGIDDRRPATLSPALLDGLLRRELNYEGVVFTDDLEMKAIADRIPLGRAAVKALAAGADVPLVCHEHERIVEVIEGIVKAVESGRLSRARLEAAVGRVEVLRARIVTTPVAGGMSVIGCDAHKALADQLTALAAKDTEAEG